MNSFKHKLDPKDWLEYVTGEQALVASALGPVIFDADRCKAFASWLGEMLCVSTPAPIRMMAVFTSYLLEHALGAIGGSNHSENAKRVQAGIDWFVDGRGTAASGLMNNLNGLPNQELDLVLFTDSRLWILEFKVRSSEKPFRKEGDFTAKMELQLAKQVAAGLVLRRLVDLDDVQHILITERLVKGRGGDVEPRLEIDVASVLDRAFGKKGIDVATAVRELGLEIPKSAKVSCLSWTDIIGFMKRTPGCETLGASLARNPVVRQREE